MTYTKKEGFTLIEILIALMILGVSSGVIINIFSESLHRLHESEMSANAGFLAQSLLDRAEDVIGPQPGDKIGNFDNGFYWRLHVEPYGDAQDQDSWFMRAYRISATVSWDDRNERKEVTLETLHLLPKEM